MLLSDVSCIAGEIKTRVNMNTYFSLLLAGLMRNILYPAGKASYIDKNQPLIDAQEQLLNEENDVKAATEKLMVRELY